MLVSIFIQHTTIGIYNKVQGQNIACLRPAIKRIKNEVRKHSYACDTAHTQKKMSKCSTSTRDYTRSLVEK